MIGMTQIETARAFRFGSSAEESVCVCVCIEGTRRTFCIN